MAPYQAFTIGGLGSVRGYGEGAVGSGRSCLVANSEFTIPLVCEHCFFEIAKHVFYSIGIFKLHHHFPQKKVGSSITFLQRTSTFQLFYFGKFMQLFLNILGK